MTDCQDVQDILINYLNRRLDQKDNYKIVVHLAGCKKCREEMALLIKLKNSQTDRLKEIPQKVISSAFNLIPEMQPQYRSLLHLDPLYDSLKLVSLTVRFAKQIV
jgi:hypothetical protein